MSFGRASLCHVVLRRQGWAWPQIREDRWLYSAETLNPAPGPSKCKCVAEEQFVNNFTCFTTSARAGLGSNPNYEEDCGGCSCLL